MHELPALKISIGNKLKLALIEKDLTQQ